MTWLLIISFILLIAFEFTCAWIDDEHYDKKQWVEDKTSRIFNRITAIFMLSMGTFFVEPWMPLVAFIGYASIFGATFDPIINTVRGFKIYYVGSVGRTDQLIHEFPWLNTWGRLALFLFGVFILIQFVL